MGLNVYFSEPVCLCWLTERGKAVWVQCGDLIQCDSKEILPFPSSSNSQHGISSGPVMCRAALVSCAVAAAETAAPGCYRKLQEATGSLSSWGCLGVGDGRTKQLLLIDKSTIYVFTSASQHSMKVVRFVITRCWLGKKVTKMIWKVAIFSKKFTKLPTMTFPVFTVDQSLLTWGPAAAEEYLPIPVTSIHIFGRRRTRNLPRVPHTLT